MQIFEFKVVRILKENIWVLTHEPTHTGNINIKTWEEGEEAKGSGVEEEEPVLSKL